MYVLGICSSPSPDGNTARLVRAALDGAGAAGARVEEVHLPALRIEHCRGCMVCMATGRCAIDDEFEGLRKKLLAADGLILGSPTYALLPNARMKVFQERMGTFWVYTSLLSDKYIAGISTAGGMGARRVARRLTGLVHGFFGSGRISGTLGIHRGERPIDPRALARAKALGRRLARDIAVRRAYRFQDPIGRLGRRLAGRVMAQPRVIAGRHDTMKAVYQTLVERGALRAGGRLRRSG